MAQRAAGSGNRQPTAPHLVTSLALPPERGDQIRELCARIGVPAVEQLTLEMLDPEALVLLSAAHCRELEVLPLQLGPRGSLRLAMVDPTDMGRIDDVRFMTGMRIEPVLMTRELFASVIAELYPEGAAIQERMRQIEDIHVEVGTARTDPTFDISEPESYDQAPVIALVNLILKQAIVSRASDIHIEPKERHCRVRYRTDGVLVERDPIGASLRPGVTARIKVLAGIDITEKRVPQDGSFSFQVDGRRLDCRVSTFPTIHGEKVVMRLLDGSGCKLKFEDMNFPPQVGEGVRKILRCREGIFLVTGPTGSGKSTTLFTLLSCMDSPGINMVTLEDPVEYQLESLSQGQTNAKAGFTFAGGLRAILRQDPDVILVGEIRDAETARIAVQAALTGHLVFSTLHTNSACEAVIRLHDMGIESFLLAAALRGALAQRLARRLCPACKQPYQPTAETRAELAATGVEIPADATLFRPEGCRACDGSGFRGRLGLYELFQLNDELQRQVARGADSTHLIETARAGGFRTLREDGVSKVLAGVTALEEVYRVT